MKTKTLLLASLVLYFGTDLKSAEEEMELSAPMDLRTDQELDPPPLYDCRLLLSDFHAEVDAARELVEIQREGVSVTKYFVDKMLAREQELKDKFYEVIYPRLLYLHSQFQPPLGKKFLDSIPVPLYAEAPLNHPKLAQLKEDLAYYKDECGIERPLPLRVTSIPFLDSSNTLSDVITLSLKTLDRTYLEALGVLLHELGHRTESEELKALGVLVFTELERFPPGSKEAKLCSEIAHFIEDRADTTAALLNADAAVASLQGLLEGDDAHLIVDHSNCHPDFLARISSVKTIQKLLATEKEKQYAAMENSPDL